jgi:hypothetical protein
VLNGFPRCRQVKEHLPNEVSYALEFGGSRNMRTGISSVVYCEAIPAHVTMCESNVLHPMSFKVLFSLCCTALVKLV